MFDDQIRVISMKLAGFCSGSYVDPNQSKSRWYCILKNRDFFMRENVWPRNQNRGPNGGLSTGPGGGMSTGPNGGASTGPNGGMSTGPGGGLSTGPGGGLSTGPGGGMSNGPTPYMSNIPPWPVLIKELELRGHQREADLIKRYL